MIPENLVNVVLYVVGIWGLLCVLVVYWLQPELRQPLGFRALMIHTAALSAAMLVRLVGHCIPQVENYDFCVALAFIRQFFLLAAFFWLSIMCYDITRFRHTFRIPSSKVASRRFMYYSLFACCGPMIPVGISTALYYASLPPYRMQRPMICNDGCWFNDAPTSFVLYFEPVAFLQLTNIAMFTSIIVRLRTILNNSSSLQSANSGVIEGYIQKRVLLFANLIILMIVTWMLEVMARSEMICKHAEMVIDCVSVLRSVGVFVVISCKFELFSTLTLRRSLKPRPESGALLQSHLSSETFSSIPKRETI